MIKSSAAALSILLSVASSAAFSAAVTITGAQLAGSCDGIDVGVTVPAHELGIAFPGNELISVSAITTSAVACPQNLPAGAINVEVTITNLTPGAWFSDLYYVAETGTTFSNYDGLINDMLAFRIDKAGLNVPLVSESKLADLLFAPGESWTFIIDNFRNGGGVGAAAIQSIGVPAADRLSSGSIVATNCIPDICCEPNNVSCIPEPGGVALLGASLMAIVNSRRRQLTHLIRRG